MIYLIGLAESAFYPGMQYMIGSWYRKDELAKRSCIFHTSSAIATMFSGYLMAAVINLDGRNGFAGWQWYTVQRMRKLFMFKSNLEQVVYHGWCNLSTDCAGGIHLHPRCSRDDARILFQEGGQ